MKSGDATITIADTKADLKAKAAGKSSVPIVAAATKDTKNPKGGWKRRPVAIFDFILRLAAIAAALAATTVMGTTDQTLPFFTRFFQFQASFDDLPALTFFVVANAIVSGYLFLSLPLSVVSIIRSRAAGARLLLLILDTVMLGLISSAGGAAAAIVYLAHNGNSTANWLAMCQQFDEFCSQISGAVVASFIADLILFLLVVIAALSLRKRSK